MCSKATNLIRHVRSRHENETFTCAVADCGKAFTRKDNLKKHYAECKSRAMSKIIIEEKNQLQTKFSHQRRTTTFSGLFENYVQDRSDIVKPVIAFSVINLF